MVIVLLEQIIYLVWLNIGAKIAAINTQVTLMLLFQHLKWNSKNTAFFPWEFGKDQKKGHMTCNMPLTT